MGNAEYMGSHNVTAVAVTHPRRMLPLIFGHTLYMSYRLQDFLAVQHGGHDCPEEALQYCIYVAYLFISISYVIPYIIYIFLTDFYIIMPCTASNKYKMKKK